MLHYQVNNKILYNPYLAYYESYKSNKPITFYCFDAEYSKLNWTQDPVETIDELMTRHAVFLRNKHKKIILPWSGGTDSHTIYNIFVQNNIHIDEIMVFVDDITTINAHAKWMVENHPDPTTEITVVKLPTVDKDNIIYEEHPEYGDDWMFQNKGRFLKVGRAADAEYFNIYCQRKYNDTDYVVVLGLEKSSVYYEAPYWYSKQNDILSSLSFGHENIDCFFLEPMINLKQSHIAKNTLKMIQQTRPDKPNLVADPRVRETNKLEYQLIYNIHGRHPELIPGMSAFQKIYISSSEGYYSLEVTPDLQLRNGEKFLRDIISAENKVGMTYLRSIYNFLSDKKFYNFLNQNAFVTPGGIGKLKPIWSKSYNLGV